MQRGQTKSQLLTAELDAQIKQANEALVQARSVVSTWETRCQILEETRTTVLMTLAPKSRSNGATLKPSKPKATKSSPDARCTVMIGAETVCDELAGSPVHDPKGGYAGFHPFVSLVFAPNAGKRSRSAKSLPTASVANTEVEITNATTVSKQAADKGDE